MINARLATVLPVRARDAARLMAVRLKSTGRGSRAPDTATSGANLISSSPAWAAATRGQRVQRGLRDPPTSGRGSNTAHSRNVLVQEGRLLLLVDAGASGSGRMSAVEDGELVVAARNVNDLCNLLEETPLLMQGVPALGSRRKTRGPRGLQELTVGDVKILHIS